VQIVALEQSWQLTIQFEHEELFKKYEAMQVEQLTPLEHV
jgi:hypothetical protein